MSTPTTIILLIQERTGDQIARFTVEVEPAPPHAIKQFQFQVIPRPAEFAIPHLSESELVDALWKRIDELVAADHVKAYRNLHYQNSLYKDLTRPEQVGKGASGSTSAFPMRTEASPPQTSRLPGPRHDKLKSLLQK